MVRPAVPPAPPLGWGPRPPAATTVALGSVVLDVGHGAAVVGRLRAASASRPDGGEDSLERIDVFAAAEALVAAGAVAVELPIPSRADPDRVGSVVAGLVERLDVPVLVQVSAPISLEAALAAGAVAAVVGHPLPDQDLALVAASGASLVVPGDGSPSARRHAHALGVAALGAGVSPDRVLLDVGAAADGRSDVPGLAIVVTDPVDPDDQADEARGVRSAALALGIALGGRLLRTADPHVARRTSVALAAIALAQHEGAPT